MPTIRLLWTIFFCCLFTPISLGQIRTPRIDSLIIGITKLTYASQFDSAQAMALDYLKLPNLSKTETFYGHFIFADIAKSSGNSSKAVELLLKSMNYLKEVPNKPILESLIYGNIGECYFNIQDYPNAKKYALLSIQVSPDSSLRGSGHAVNNLIIGYSDFKAEKYTAALNYYNNAIREYLIHGEPCELPLCYMKIASVQQAQNQTKLAKQTLERAVLLSDSCNINQYKLLTKLALFDYCKQNNLYKDALVLMEDINTINSMLYDERKSKSMRDLEVKYETELTQKENENLKKHAKTLESKANIESTIFIVSISALSIILVLLFYILSLRIRRNDALSKQLAQIEGQNEERKTLLKEVHHRVKNNLQVITSLLSLQAAQISDEKTSSLFQQSQYRINAMAMVHEMLYQSDDLSQIKIETYFQELANALIFSTKGSENNIVLQIEAPPIYLGLDTAIPLGLLINEILSNALKHGLKDSTTGEIYIKLEALTAPHYCLKIGDNGIGCPQNIDFKNTKTLGLKLIYKLARQLLGKIEVDYSKKGCHYVLYFQEVV